MRVVVILWLYQGGVVHVDQVQQVLLSVLYEVAVLGRVKMRMRL
jgi:hypothetical protein